MRKKKKKNKKNIKKKIMNLYIIIYIIFQANLYLYFYIKKIIQLMSLYHFCLQVFMYIIKKKNINTFVGVLFLFVI